ILGAVYMLTMLQKMLFGPLSNPRNRELPDLSLREKLVFAPIVLLIFGLGIRPAPVLSRMDTAIARVLSDARHKLDESSKAQAGALLMGASTQARLAPAQAIHAPTPGQGQYPVAPFGGDAIR